jgi:hypothetical protein
MVDAMTFSGNNRKEDLGDLTFEPNLPHRLIIQISGAARGTGSNTPTGAASAITVNLANAVNVSYDFIPATGAAIPPSELTREDVNIDTCNVCHEKLAFHGGSGRVDVKYCVTCHTDQRGFGRAKATSTAGKFPALTERATVNAVTGITSYSYTPDTYIADGEVSGNFTTLIHKIHNGTALVKDNYHYGGIAFNNKGFSKLGGGQRMCTTCHDSTVATTADNFKNLPSRQACGACHDGIDWATGGGSTLADKAAATAVGAVVATSGHVGRGQADDSKCAGCHTPEYNVIDHRMENITKNNPVILDGLATFTYDIKSAAVNGANDLTIEFGIKQRIAPSTTDTLVTLANPAPSVSASLAGFSGGPSFLLAYALPQDGVATPVDYNNLGRPQAQPRSVSVAALLSTNNAANGTLAASTATAGYYIATIKGSGAVGLPGGCHAARGGHAGLLHAGQRAAGHAGQQGLGGTPRHLGDQEHHRRHRAPHRGGRREVRELPRVVRRPRRQPRQGNPGLRGLPRARPGHQRPRRADSLLNTWTFDKASSKIIADWKFDKTLPNAALKFPVVTNNFKEMIHGIHAGRERVVPFQDARDRSSSRRDPVARLPSDGLPRQAEQLRNLPRDGRHRRAEDLQLHPRQLADDGG